jgi:Flp pilus assembly protein TadG
MAMRRMLQRLIPARFRRFAATEKGTTAVEFALVAPTFIFMMFLIVESGMMLFTEYVLQINTNQAARKIRTGQAQQVGYDISQLKARICGPGTLAAVVMDCSKVAVYVRADASFATLKANLPSHTQVFNSFVGDTNKKGFKCGQPLQAGAVIATYDWKFAVPLIMGPFGNVNVSTKSWFGATISGSDTRRLAGLTVYRNEPFPTGWNKCVTIEPT